MTTAGPPRTVPLVLLIGLVAAIAVGATGVFARLAFPAPQLIILPLVSAAIVIRRAWVDTLSWRTLVGFHGIRLIGAVFVWLGARGVLAPMFARRAGWGDIAAFAVAPTRAKLAYNAWNLFGLLDLTVWVTQQGLVPGVEPLFWLPATLSSSAG